MQEVRFWVNNKQHKEAISKLGDKAELYGFAKEAFLSKLEEIKELKKIVWYVCPDQACGKEYHFSLKVLIEEATGRLIPTCVCGKGLVRRVKRVANGN